MKSGSIPEILAEMQINKPVQRNAMKALRPSVSGR